MSGEHLTNALKRYQKCVIEMAQVIAELIEMVRRFHAAASRG